MNSSVEYSKSARLKLKYIDFDACEESMIIYTTRVLTIAQIYHMEIPEENVHIGALIQAVNLFPEVNTLKIHSLSLYEPRMLNSEELLILSSTEDTSKITKVYLEKMTEIGEFYFLLKLCPYMEYFRVDYIKHTDFKFVLRYIIKKLKDECNDYLHLLCFHIPTADDEMIKKLKTMIYSEKLLFNFTIKRVVDNIYLEWK